MFIEKFRDILIVEDNNRNERKYEFFGLCLIVIIELFKVIF